jgi:hypothetical protein
MVTPAGSVSVTPTDGVPSGPLLVTVMRHATAPPATGAVVVTLSSARSVCGTMRFVCAVSVASE